MGRSDAHPGYVAKLKKSRDKTDYGDAWLSADLLHVNYLPEVWIADERTRTSTVAEHYAKHLDPIYSRMVGDFDSACAQADSWFDEIDLFAADGRISRLRAVARSIVDDVARSTKC